MEEETARASTSPTLEENLYRDSGYASLNGIGAKRGFCRSGCAFARGTRALGALLARIPNARRCRRTDARNTTVWVRRYRGRGAYRFGTSSSGIPSALARRGLTFSGNWTLAKWP